MNTRIIKTNAVEALSAWCKLVGRMHRLRGPTIGEREPNEKRTRGEWKANESRVLYRSVVYRNSDRRRWGDTEIANLQRLKIHVPKDSCVASDTRSMRRQWAASGAKQPQQTIVINSAGGRLHLLHNMQFRNSELSFEWSRIISCTCRLFTKPWNCLSLFWFCRNVGVNRSGSDEVETIRRILPDWSCNFSRGCAF